MYYSSTTRRKYFYASIFLLVLSLFRRKIQRLKSLSQLSPKLITPTVQNNSTITNRPPKSLKQLTRNSSRNKLNHQASVRNNTKRPYSPRLRSQQKLKLLRATPAQSPLEPSQSPISQARKPKFYRGNRSRCRQRGARALARTPLGSPI